jgi:hypothetical protein
VCVCVVDTNKTYRASVQVESFYQCAFVSANLQSIVPIVVLLMLDRRGMVDVNCDQILKTAINRINQHAYLINQMHARCAFWRVHHNFVPINQRRRQIRAPSQVDTGNCYNVEKCMRVYKPALYSAHL